MKKLIAVSAGAVVIALVGATTGAVAGSLVSSADIKDGTIKSKDLTPNLDEKIAKHAADGKNGANGKDATFGAVYRVANYTAGGGGRATVACADTEVESMKYTAIAGGARTEVPGAGTNTEAIVSSFPGRMDWTQGQGGLPKPNRLDGWVVYFDGGAAPTGAAVTRSRSGRCASRRPASPSRSRTTDPPTSTSECPGPPCAGRGTRHLRSI